MPEFDVDKVLRGFEKEKHRSALRSALKRQRRNTGPKAPRRRDWDGGLGDEDAVYLEREHIMPRDEGDRRRVLEEAARAFARPPAHPVDSPAVDGTRGVVIAAGEGGLCRVHTGQSILVCRLRGLVSAEDTGAGSPVAVGDEVVVSPAGTGEGLVEAVLPRRTVLTRPEVLHGYRQQVIVANADQLLIVSSWREPTIWLELVDRCLIAAERGGLVPIVCINKADLAEEANVLVGTAALYRNLGYRAVVTSARTGQGIEELRSLLRERTTVMAGLSGTGKSSLASAVQPGLRLRTAEVSRFDDQGRHTTTQAVMLPLDMGGAVVDTPGVREYGLGGLAQGELAEFFPDIVALAPECRFSDCRHLLEPGCAVRQAAERQGSIAANRYHSYLRIYETLLP